MRVRHTTFLTYQMRTRPRAREDPAKHVHKKSKAEEDARLVNLHGEQEFSTRALCTHVRVDMTRIVLIALPLLAADMNGWPGERATITRIL